MTLKFSAKFYLPTPRRGWEWLSPEEVVRRLKAWGDELDVCLYVSPLVRAGEEHYFLPILDLDSKAFPSRACDASFFLLNEGERDQFCPVLSGKKGIKLVAKFLLLPSFKEAFLVWAKRRAKKAGIKALGVDLDLQPILGRLDPENPPSLFDCGAGGGRIRPRPGSGLPGSPRGRSPGKH